MHADADADGHPGTCQLLERLQGDLVGLLPSPVGGIEGQAEHPELAERAQGLARELRIRLGLRGAWRELAGREVLDQGHEVDGLLGGHQARDGGALPCVAHHATTSSRGCWFATMTPSGVAITMSSMRAP